jgi:hypothetical protein
LVSDLEHGDSELFGLPTRVRSAAPTRKGNDEIGIALTQHPFIPDQRCVTSCSLPIGRVLNEIDPSRTSPLARNPIDAARVSLDHRVEAVLPM